MGHARLLEEVRGSDRSCTIFWCIYFASVVEGRAHPAPGRQGASILIHLAAFVVRKECRTYLIYHVDEGLDVVPTKGTDHITFILAREDCLNQEWELAQDERTLDQAFQGWNVEGEKEGPVRDQLMFRTRSADEDGGLDHTEASVERRVLQIKAAEYLSDLQFIFLDLPLAMVGMWRTCAPPESPLNFASEPAVG